MTASKKSRAKVQARVTLSSKTSLPETLPPNKLPQANRAMIEQSLSVGMGRALGIRLKKLSRTRIDAEMRVTEDHINRSGRINGGVLMAFADLLGAMGTLANLPEGFRTTTLESKTNFFCGRCRRYPGGNGAAAAYRPHDDGVADHDQKPGWHAGGDCDADADRDSAENLIPDYPRCNEAFVQKIALTLSSQAVLYTAPQNP